MLKTILITFFFLPSLTALAESISSQAKNIADYSVATYRQQVIESLSEMVKFKTIAVEGQSIDDNPEFINYKLYLEKLSESLGFDFEDHGYIVLISFGAQQNRLGILTHGDVQPADPSKWASDPFRLDSNSEPGLLIARGTEDDKSSIASVLYAMKSVKDNGVKLNKSIELIIYFAEESDWGPFKNFLESYKPPEMSVTLDASYPVVTAEKGYSSISFDIPAVDKIYETAFIKSFAGGVFASQVPEDATVVIRNASKFLLDRLREESKRYREIEFTFDLTKTTLHIAAKGISAHSAEPENGINAIAFLAKLLENENWPQTTASLAVNFINELVGTGYYAETFGQIAYQHDFMGKLTLVASIVKPSDTGIHINLNLRRPKGKSTSLLVAQTSKAMKRWQRVHSTALENIEIVYGDYLLLNQAEQVAPLLDIFAHFTERKDSKPISIGGSTNAQLLPNTVSFGPSMPGEKYTGHSEHEFISVKQLELNLKMYTAMIIELGNL